MGLGELPAAVLDVVVECAGFEHGWRLEVVSSSLQATSMECAAVRLGKCLRMGDGRNAEFAPSWRHVAVALRRGPYYVLRPGTGQTHLKFPTLHACRVPRHEADKFIVAPTGDGEGIVELINGDEDQWRYVGERTTERLAILEIDGFNEPFLQVDEDGISRLRWLLHLGSHTSHLPFRRCRMDDGSIRRVLGAWGEDYRLYHVPHWELAPATLADDERFEWRVV